MSRRSFASKRGGFPRGYTVVELLMAIAVFGIGVAGIISMEKVASASNQQAKNLAIATHIAESWLDQLKNDASVWNHPSPGIPTSDLSDSFWLPSTVTNAGVGSWFLPAWNPALNFGPAFDALGNTVNTTAGVPASVVFCSNLRLSYLYPPNQSGNGLIRAEVRVFWLREGSSTPQAGTNPCATNMPTTTITASISSFHFVQKISAIRENTATG